jgi:hypothetical protein
LIFDRELAIWDLLAILRVEWRLRFIEEVAALQHPEARRAAQSALSTADLICDLRPY